jgi:hypothetical protein
VSEFGHHAASVVIGDGVRVYIDSWGSGPFTIEAEGKTFRFEDSDRFGPMLVTECGNIADPPQPGERSPFWRAHRIWVRQGRRLAEDGVSCRWVEPKPTLVRRFSRRSAVVIEHGKEDGEVVEVE